MKKGQGKQHPTKMLTAAKVHDDLLSGKTAPNCTIDFYSRTTIANSALAYDKMLKLGPVVWLECQKMMAVCGHKAVTTVLRDHRCFSSARGVSINEQVNELLIGSTLNSDPPDHDKTRSITFTPLTPKALTNIREHISLEANRLAGRMVKKRCFDGAAELAPYLPLTIVRDLVGLGGHGKENMLSWGAATFELMGDPRERREVALSNMTKLREFLEDTATLENLANEGWAQRATQRGVLEGFDNARAAELMRDYIAPSLDTTISAIGYAIWLFSNNPDQWTQLRADRSLIKNAIEEIVRLNTPIRAFSRYTLHDTAVSGVRITKNSRVLIVFGAANRDPDKFSNPNEFNIKRNTRGHVGFGHGVHACLGMHLARLEMECLINALADRVKQFHLTGDVIPGTNSTIFSFTKVPVRVDI